MILSNQELNAGLKASDIVIDSDLEGKITRELVFHTITNPTRGSECFGLAGLEASRVVNDVDGDGLCE